MYFTDHKQKKGKEKGKERGAEEGRGPQSERRFGELGPKPSGRGIGREKGTAAGTGNAFILWVERKGERSGLGRKREFQPKWMEGDRGFCRAGSREPGRWR